MNNLNLCNICYFLDFITSVKVLIQQEKVHATALILFYGHIYYGYAYPEWRYLFVKDDHHLTKTDQKQTNKQLADE